MSDSGFRLDSDSDSELAPIEILDNVDNTSPEAVPIRFPPSSNSDTDADYVVIPSPIPFQIPSSSTSSFISDPEFLGSTGMTTTTTANNTNLYRGHAAWEAMERPAATRNKRGARQHHKHRRHRHRARDRTNDVPLCTLVYLYELAVIPMLIGLN